MEEEDFILLKIPKKDFLKLPEDVWYHFEGYFTVKNGMFKYKPTAFMCATNETQFEKAKEVIESLNKKELQRADLIQKEEEICRLNKENQRLQSAETSAN